MSNFEGNVKKTDKSFRPQTSAGSDAGIGRVVAGVYAGQNAPVVFEKADQPVLDTTPTPRTDGRGESEIGLSGQVDHPNNDGQAVYAAAQLAREYRHIVAQVGGIEDWSVEQRRQMRDELVRRVGATADGAQQPEGDSASARATRVYVREVASLLFGLIDELSETPDFLRAPKPPTSDDLRVGRIGRDYLKPVSKMEGGEDETDCPHCGKAMRIDTSAVSRLTGIGTFTCPNCSKKWDGNPSLMLRKSTPANPEIAALQKQLLALSEKIRSILARRAGVDPMGGRRTGQDGGERFVTKAVGSGNDPQQLIKQALANGVPVPFSGADPRSEAEKASGSGRRFQARG